MPVVEWSARALRDLRALDAYLRARSPSAAEMVLDRIFDRLDEAATDPRRYQEGRMPGARQIVAHPNYLVHYRAVTGGVRVLRILHASQHTP